MKKLLSLVLLTLGALLGTPEPAHAQQYSALALTVTNRIDGAATNAAITGGAITLTKYEDLGLSFQLQGSDAGDTSAVTFKFARSPDGTTYDTLNLLSYAVTANGVSKVNLTTNLTVGAVGYLKLITIENPNAQEVTNIVVKVAKKPKRNG